MSDFETHPAGTGSRVAELEAAAARRREKPHGYLSPAYCFVVPIVQEAARKVGYAIAVHGSMNSDLDLVAIPWTADAGSAEELVDAVRQSCAAFYKRDPQGDLVSCPSGFVALHPTPPEAKPHGRLAYDFQLGNGARIDLSVMPRASA